MESLDIRKLQEMEFSELKNFALTLGMSEYTGSRKEELINEIIEAKSDGDAQFYGGGVLEILDDRDQHYGFCVHRAPIIYRAMRISTYHHRKSGDLICRRVMS